MTKHPRYDRYVRVKAHGHPRSDATGNVLAHVIIAEKALGKHLPAGAEVHHVDDDGKNNAHSNLVICQDAAYHKLLHARARIVRIGGNPNTQRICSTCRQMKAVEDFNRSLQSSLGTQTQCRECQSAYCRSYERKDRRVAA